MTGLIAALSALKEHSATSTLLCYISLFLGCLVGQLTSRDKHLCKDHHSLAQGQSLRQSDEVVSFRLNVTRKADEEVHTLLIGTFDLTPQFKN